MLEKDFLEAILPLLSLGDIDAIEWSFDTTINNYKSPYWLSELLNEFGKNNRLLGHGVYYSLFDARWTNRQEVWLTHLKQEIKKHNFTHITEHFGFMSSDNYHKSYPLPVSLHPKVLEIGIDRLKRLQDAVKLPVGIENLALSFSINDIQEQGSFIEKMIDEVGGFLILDLHNIYCQAHNFEVDIFQIINSYPLEKVREIHISGGSWQQSIYTTDKQIRRDTHDNEIPEILFEILPIIIPMCPNLEFIIFERFGNTFNTVESFSQYRFDFYRLKKIVDNFHQTGISNWTKSYTMSESPVTDIFLAQEQQALSSLLLNEKDINLIKEYRFNYWDTQNWDLEMIHTAKEISLKWST